jgi:hypothetical protein
VETENAFPVFKTEKRIVITKAFPKKLPAKLLGPMDLE